MRNYTGEYNQLDKDQKMKLLNFWTTLKPKRPDADEFDKLVAKELGVLQTRVRSTRKKMGLSTNKPKEKQQIDFNFNFDSLNSATHTIKISGIKTKDQKKIEEYLNLATKQLQTAFKDFDKITVTYEK